MTEISKMSEWKTVPAINHDLQSAPRDWPSPIHQVHDFSKAPPLSPITQFIYASRARSAVASFLRILPEQTTPVLARQNALKASGNLWYLEHQPYVATPWENIKLRQSRSFKGQRFGQFGSVYTNRPLWQWAPTVALFAVFAFRYQRVDFP
eukprot:NODE_10446_length_515_cov_1.551020_g9798_i0.p1 GENE.NODE_10446_length_515_cov_1.551020_g9798_i0~~NODE_10446_length_515_cov_1.551020_g9798_i0.p1  ORF type:complete len:151 (+),score=10.30 NODE_10446_length_515_cov_1.551020_g9798_i0:36-488(+)